MARAALKRPQFLAVLLFTIVPIKLMAILNYFEQMPFGATRHSQILMVPVVVVFCGLLQILLENRSRLPVVKNLSHLIAIMAMANVITLLVAYPRFREATSRRFNVDQVDDLCKEHHANQIWELGTTWDYDIANTFFPDSHKGCGEVQRIDAFDKKTKLENLVKDKNTNTVMVASQIYDLDRIFDDKTKSEYIQNLQFTSVKSLPPIGSTEPIGNINGGNGFYVMKISKRQETIEIKEKGGLSR
jgi:hypothetical protein